MPPLPRGWLGSSTTAPSAAVSLPASGPPPPPPPGGAAAPAGTVPVDATRTSRTASPLASNDSGVRR